jgi:histidine kinase/DNA gyrase B/HSP90-like ATPase
MVEIKTQIEPIDGTPKKRFYLSIISDYDLKAGLCELIDNAVDLWMTGDRSNKLVVDLELDADRQLISVTDNAGGVRRHELSVLIAPGESKNDLAAEVIGVFGVGGKRAGIALAEQVTIKTRFQEEETSELNITQAWLQTDDWNLPAYAIPDIEPGTTQVEMSHLRKSLRPENIDYLRTHFGETYDWFLNQGCALNVNGVPVVPVGFETWAFPPNYPPRHSRFDVDMGRSGKLSCEITGGLSNFTTQSFAFAPNFLCSPSWMRMELKRADFASSYPSNVQPLKYRQTTSGYVSAFESSFCSIFMMLDFPPPQSPKTPTVTGRTLGSVMTERMRSA